MKEISKRIAVYRAAEGSYPSSPPYHPSDRYLEYPFVEVSTERNFDFDAVRGALRLAGLDGGRFGAANWSPLAEIISQGEMVVIKPNMVRDFHDEVERGTDPLITHGSVV